MVFLIVVDSAVDGVIVDEDRNRGRGRRSDGLVGEVTVARRRPGLVVTVTDTAGRGRARRDTDFSGAAGAGCQEPK